jgi:2-haloalkanoic acid dehalogenase type II
MIYPELLASAHRRLTEEWGIAAGEEEHRAFGASVGDWPAFADSADSLRYLKRFHKLVILSNVDRRSSALSNQHLGVVFDAVHTAEEIGSYKPDPRNFRHMIDALKADGYAEGDILHVAQSLFHDHAPANALGLASVWIDRRRGAAASGATVPPPIGARYDFRYYSLAEMVEAHRAERSE